ncbi:25700_t:CDS:2, partial [Gigaspora rosea]
NNSVPVIPEVFLDESYCYLRGRLKPGTSRNHPKEGIVFEEIEVDEDECVLEGNENERTVLEENEVIVLEDSEEENEEISEVPANEAPAAYEGIKVYTSQSTTSDQRRALLFNVGEPFELIFFSLTAFL